MVSVLISRIVILVFGTLYPAYASYKAIKTKNVKEYVKWMMYWVVFALFISVETFADVFLSWFPFYYEIKIVFVLWMLSPATRGSSLLYRKFVHPQFIKHEKMIDDSIIKFGDQGYSALLTLGSKSVSYATTLVARAALKGHHTVMDQLRKSYSMNDISDQGMLEDAPSSSRARREAPIPESDEPDTTDDDAMSDPGYEPRGSYDDGTARMTASSYYDPHPPKGSGSSTRRKPRRVVAHQSSLGNEPVPSSSSSLAPRGDEPTGVVNRAALRSSFATGAGGSTQALPTRRTIGGTKATASRFEQHS